MKDTPLEKTNHEASPRHQGNLKRSLRDLHRNNEKAEREKQYAKVEAARLNGTGPAVGPLSGSGDGKFKTTVNFTRTPAKAANPDDRKRQVAQLAALGVAVPEDFRRENAMVGDWQVTAQKITWDSNAGTKQEEEVDVKPGLNIGVRKRKNEEGEEDLEPAKLEEDKKRPRYGRDLRGLPGNDDDDLNALLESTSRFTRKDEAKIKAEPKKELAEDELIQNQETQELESSTVHVKEEPDETTSLDVATVKRGSDAETQQPSDDIGSIFKKRKRPATKK